MDVALPDGDGKALEDDDEDQEEDSVGDEQARAERLLKQRWVVEDQCRWTIFEDLEDELKYHRRRSRALCCFVRAYSSLREERDRLQTAGLGLQEMYEQMEDELNDAIGDAAYWRALAEGDADSPGGARAKAVDVSGCDEVTDTASSAATSEEEVSSGEYEATMEEVASEAIERKRNTESAKRRLEMSDESETSDDEEAATAETPEPMHQDVPVPATPEKWFVHQDDAEKEDESAEQEEVFAEEQVELREEASATTEEIELFVAEQQEDGEPAELDELDAEVQAQVLEELLMATDEQESDVAEQEQEVDATEEREALQESVVEQDRSRDKAVAEQKVLIDEGRRSRDVDVAEDGEVIKAEELQTLEFDAFAKEEERQTEEDPSEDGAEQELYAEKGASDVEKEEDVAEITPSAVAVEKALDSSTDALASSAESCEDDAPRSPGLRRCSRVVLAKRIAKLFCALLIAPVIIFPFTSSAACSIFLLSGVTSNIRLQSSPDASDKETFSCYLELIPAKMRSYFVAITGAVDWAFITQDGHLPVADLDGVVAETGCNSTFQFSGSAFLEGQCIC